jgi:hypothetical protein
MQRPNNLGRVKSQSWRARAQQQLRTIAYQAVHSIVDKAAVVGSEVSITAAYPPMLLPTDQTKSRAAFPSFRQGNSSCPVRYIAHAFTIKEQEIHHEKRAGCDGSPRSRTGLDVQIQRQ